MKLFFILGNQLFPSKYLDRFKKDHLFFMAEDYQLCTYEKHHKNKILLFLSSMRSHAENLKKDKFKLEYLKIEDKEFKDDYLKKLKKTINSKKNVELILKNNSLQIKIRKLKHYKLKPKLDNKRLKRSQVLKLRINFLKKKLINLLKKKK